MREDIMETFKYLKIEKAPEPTEVYAEMIIASGDVGIRVLMEHCHRILDEKGMPEDWATSVAIPIFKGDIMNCGKHRGVIPVEHAMKMYLRTIVTMDDMQFGFMLGKDTIDAVFILRRIQEYLAKQKSCTCDL